jgi:hypothetical protein
MNRISAATITTGLLVCFAISAGCRYHPEPGADLVLVNGRVYTLNWGEPSLDGSIAADAPHDNFGWHPDADAVAVTDGHVVFVGSSGDAEAYLGSATRVMDVGGAVVLPGLVDSFAARRRPLTGSPNMRPMFHRVSGSSVGVGTRVNGPIAIPPPRI